MKNSNILPNNGYLVKICDGMKVICSKNFSSEKEAYSSAKKIIENQKEICGESMTAYAMVFNSKKMLYYFD